jgi:hypothetical protein
MGCGASKKTEKKASPAAASSSAAEQPVTAPQKVKAEKMDKKDK